MASDQDVEHRLKVALADRYTIEREIGSGGMATVYLAISSHPSCGGSSMGRRISSHPSCGGIFNQLWGSLMRAANSLLRT